MDGGSRQWNLIRMSVAYDIKPTFVHFCFNSYLSSHPRILCLYSFIKQAVLFWNSPSVIISDNVLSFFIFYRRLKLHTSQSAALYIFFTNFQITLHKYSVINYISSQIALDWESKRWGDGEGTTLRGRSICSSLFKYPLYKGS